MSFCSTFINDEREANQSLLYWEMVHAPKGITVIDLELEIMVDELKSTIDSSTPVNNVDINEIELWCRNPKNDNYPEISKIDFTHHPP